MTDTNSFSSLLALVDNHLSKTNLQGSHSEDGGPPSSGIQIPSLHGPASLSESRLSYSPGQRLPIPSLNLSESPIANVLAEQVANMLKAKEKRQKEEEEKRKLEEEMLKLKLQEDDDLVIDLMEALKTPYVPGPPMPKQNVLSSSSSFESLFEAKFIDCEVDPLAVQKSASKVPLLSCKTDMSYILKQKVPRGKCSNFGKVLVSRYRPIAAPYLREKVNSNIAKFDFKSPSPCDVIKDRLKKPYMYQQESECVLRVRLIQSFHVESRGWDDIGYNFLVGGDGSAYYGRGWDYIGAHTKGYNKYSIAIAFIGTFSLEAPPRQQLDACKKLINIGVSLGKLSKNYKLLAHSQLMSTASPGQKLFDIIKEWPHFVKDPSDLDETFAY